MNKTGYSRRLDYKSCRKLSVLPEEQVYDLSGGGWVVVRQMSDPGGGGGCEAASGCGGVRRQASDPSPRSTTRPLQLPSRGDSAISSAGSTTSSPLPPPQPPPPSPPPPTSSSDTSLSFFTPDDYPTDPTLSPPSLLSPPALPRVPSKRKLVRSLATDNASDSDSPQKHHWDLSDLLVEEMEAVDAGAPAECVVSEAPPPDDPQPKTNGEHHQHHAQEQEEEEDKSSRSLATLIEHPQALQEIPQNPEEIESLATSLTIAFKTDKLTLLRRLEIQTRLRDQSEINVANEILALRATAQQLSPLKEDGEKADILKKLEEQIETLHRSARYVSSVAEMYGAVQHEKRLSNAMEVIAKHVENLKVALETERQLHDETKKLLKENKPNLNLIKLDSNKRRASIATLDQCHASPDSRLTNRKGSLIKRFGNCKSSSYSEINVALRKVDSDKNLNKMEESREGDSVDYNESSLDCSSCQCKESLQQSHDDDDMDEIDDFQRSQSIFQDDEPVPPRKHPMRYKFQKRGSFIAPDWMVKLAEKWGWLHRVGDIATQARYFVAAMCVVAAIAILSSSIFFSSPDDAL